MFVRDSLDKIAWAGPVIDLGGGNESKYVQPYFAGHKYIKLNIEADPNGSTDIVGDICKMPQVESNFYGVVLLLDTLEHIAWPLLAFREAARILRPGGLFICTTVASWPEHKHPKDYWRFLPDSLVLLSVTVGLQVIGLTKKPYGPRGAETCCVVAAKEKKQNENPDAVLQLAIV